MITIEYCKEGLAISDFSYSDWVYNVKQTIKDGKDHKFEVSTSIPIAALRLEIALGNIDCESITFCFWGQYFQANKYGAITNWPRGFADVECAIAEDILRVAIKQRRLEIKK